MPTVKLSYNVPITLSLLNSEGELDSTYDKVHYETSAGTLSVSRRVAVQINELELRAGEQFTICKQQKPEGVRYSVWLAGTSEKERAREESDEPTELETQLERSLERAPVRAPIRQVERVAPRRKEVARVEQPRLFDRGTGTDGPLPQSLPASRPRRPVTQQIPYNVAFAEVTRFVTSGLLQAGEQWSDQAKQDMISTVLIAASKAGMLTLWERES